MSQWKRKEEELRAQIEGLSERLERTEMESESQAEALKNARKELDHYRGQANLNEGRWRMAEEAKERQFDESEKHKAMFKEAISQTNKYKTKIEKRENEIAGLQTDLSTSVGVTKSLQSQLGDLKTVVSKVADQVKDRNGEKADTAKRLIAKMMEFRRLDRDLESARPAKLEGEEQEEDSEEGCRAPSEPESFGLPSEDGADEDRHDPDEGRRTPSEAGFLGPSLEAELEQCERRRNLDDDDDDDDDDDGASPRSSGESNSSNALSWFGSDRERDDTTSLTDLSDDETVAMPLTKPSRLAWNRVDDASDAVSSPQASPPEPKKQEHPEFRLDLLEQSGPRKRVRVRKYQDKTLVKEPNPWKGAQKSRLPVALIKDFSRWTLQDKTGKKPAKPTTKQVKTLLKQIPGNPQPERLKPLRPDRFKRSKRDKPPARNPSAAVEYTVVVDPDMAQNTNMFGNQTPANQSAVNQPVVQSTKTNQGNPTGIHGNMFAPEVLAPPVPRTAAPTNANPATTHDNAASINAPLIHWGPLATPPKPQPVAQPLRKFKPLGPPTKDRPSLPRIVRKNYPGAIYRPMPYGEGSARLDLPWAAWMTKMRADKKQTSSEAPTAQASWDFDFFQRGASSMDLLPEKRRVLLKWRIAFMGIAMLFILYCLFQNGGRMINDRDLWMEVNDVPGSVFRQMRGPPRLHYRWIDILDYEMVRLSGIDRVALG